MNSYTIETISKYFASIEISNGNKNRINKRHAITFFAFHLVWRMLCTCTRGQQNDYPKLETREREQREKETRKKRQSINNIVKRFAKESSCVVQSTKLATKKMVRRILKPVNLGKRIHPNLNGHSCHFSTLAMYHHQNTHTKHLHMIIGCAYIAVHTNIRHSVWYGKQFICSACAVQTHKNK